MNIFPYSETHCHLSMLDERGLNTQDIIQELHERQCPFLLDIGTKAGDLQQRTSFWTHVSQIPSFIAFSAGIWPDEEAIRNQKELMQILYADIEAFELKGKKLCAIGECGFDHHWNTDSSLYDSEAELFEMHIALAKEKQIPTIVHSRDAFDETHSCIKNAQYEKGVIHCYSYGKNEARSFLDMGWYISFSGTITYTKKRDEEIVRELLRYIPQERLLLETDAPYLTPVPHRGKANSPLFLEYIYTYMAECLNMSTEKLAETIKANTVCLFSNHE